MKPTEQLIRDQMKLYPDPTDEHYQAALAEVQRHGDVDISELAIRCAVRCSIDRYTLKFCATRFWDVLPEMVEMLQKQGV